MGRKLKYHTKEEKVIAQRRWSLNYYNKNKEKVDKDAKERYWKIKLKL